MASLDMEIKLLFCPNYLLFSSIHVIDLKIYNCLIKILFFDFDYKIHYIVGSYPINFIKPNIIILKPYFHIIVSLNMDRPSTSSLNMDRTSTSKKRKQPQDSNNTLAATTSCNQYMASQYSLHTPTNMNENCSRITTSMFS